MERALSPREVEREREKEEGREKGAKRAMDGTPMSADLFLVTTEFTIRVYHRAYDTNAIMRGTTCGRNYWPPTPRHVKQLDDLSRGITCVRGKTPSIILS